MGFTRAYRLLHITHKNKKVIDSKSNFLVQTAFKWQTKDMGSALFFGSKNPSKECVLQAKLLFKLWGILSSCVSEIHRYKAATMSFEKQPLGNNTLHILKCQLAGCKLLVLSAKKMGKLQNVVWILMSYIFKCVHHPSTHLFLTELTLLFFSNRKSTVAY